MFKYGCLRQLGKEATAALTPHSPSSLSTISICRGSFLLIILISFTPAS